MESPMKAQAQTPHRPTDKKPMPSTYVIEGSTTPESRPILPSRVDGRMVLLDDTPSKPSKSFLTTSRGEETTSFELTSDDEQALIRAGENAALAGPVNRVIQFNTPSKRKFGEFTNDSASLPTPETHGKRQMTAASRTGSAMKRRDGDSLEALLDIVSPQTTPTPASFKDVMGEDENIWTVLENILKDELIIIGDTARERLEGVCVTYARKNKGVLQG
jgi:hypothetical protein